MKRLPLLALALLAGCVKPPEIVVNDRATALEQQASGSFIELERNLDRSAIEPHPVPLTPEQLQALGIHPESLVPGTELTFADRQDELLVQRCIGEGKDGLLVATPTACIGAADVEEVTRVTERVNRARKQLWRWMHEQRETVSESEIRTRWQEAHVRNVVCGGWIEVALGKWEAKAC